MKSIALIDCHTHFHDEKYTNEGHATNDLIDSALSSGVKYFFSTGYDVQSSKASVRDSIKYRSVFAVVGIHPNEAANVTEEDIEEIAKLAKLDKVKGIGEIGLDFYHSDKNKERQMFVFEEQVKIAKANNLVVVLHIRDQKNHTDVYFECLKMLVKYKIKKAMIHCFTADQAVADAYIKHGYYISIGGVVTFPNAKELQGVVEKTPMKYLVTETDAPYLTPVPYRGATNKQEYMIHTVKKMAELKNVDVDEMAEVTYSNAKNLFGLI